MADFYITSPPKVDMIVNKIMNRSDKMYKECSTQSWQHHKWALILQVNGVDVEQSTSGP